MKIYNPINYSYITVVEIPKTEISKFDMALCQQPRQTLKAYYDSCAVKPSIVSNGGFFSMTDGSTAFNYTDEGIIISSNSLYKEGFGTVNGELKYGVIGQEKFEDFVSGYPVLIKAGAAVPITIAFEINYKARRTVLAYNKENIFIVAIESPGMNFSQMQSFLRTLKVDYAINLDGGGSTKILRDGKCITKAFANRPVDNIMAIYLKPKVIYRVQLGAFSKKTNADAFLAKIKTLPDTINAGYKNAYVRKVGSYWKVQVGAFSVKANATRVVNDLKNKGYNAFITTT